MNKQSNQELKISEELIKMVLQLVVGLKKS